MLIVFLIAVGLVVVNSRNTPTQPVTTVSQTPTRLPFTASAPTETVTLPTKESDFISVIGEMKSRYLVAPNEFQKSAMRRKRAERIGRSVSDLTASNWIGEVLAMSTTSDGLGALSVRLPGSSIVVKTWNNSISDSGAGTLIPTESELYSLVGSLAVHNTITFSGTFVAGSLDYVREASLTEKGSMMEPEFIFRFKTVHTGLLEPRTKDAQAMTVEPLEHSNENDALEARLPIREPAKAVISPWQPAPAPAHKVSGSRHGFVNSDYGQVVFYNLPGDRLRLTFDHAAWQPSIHREPDGGQTLTMHSLKPGTGLQCDVGWETIPPQ